MIKGIFVGP